MDTFFGPKIEVKNRTHSDHYDKCSNSDDTITQEKTIFARFCGENGENATKKSSRFLHKILHCHYCSFNTSNKHNFEKHLSTKKHLNNLGKYNSNSVDVLDQIESSPNTPNTQIQQGIELYCSCCIVRPAGGAL